MLSVLLYRLNKVKSSNHQNKNLKLSLLVCMLGFMDVFFFASRGAASSLERLAVSFHHRKNSYRGLTVCQVIVSAHETEVPSHPLAVLQCFELKGK